MRPINRLLGGVRAVLRRALGSNPLDAIGIFLLLIAAAAILVNALYRQPGPQRKRRNRQRRR